MNNKVTIVIPFFNCPFIAQAIESAINQTYQNIEIIVVNDGSTKHHEKIIPYLNRITYIKKENGGTASALNFGIQNSTGDYFAWLSSDDTFQPTKIEKQLHFMLQNNAKASYSNFYLINDQGSIVSPPQGMGFSNKVQFFKRMRRGCVINGCTVMLNMNVFKDFGLFDESLLYTQDYDFWLRILPHYHFYYFPEALVHYRVHENMGTKQHRIEIRKELQLTIQRHLTKMNALVKSFLH
ncbi:glycosyltransferase [Fictibacillus nanhaiensis]|uniref:Glycosyltransferase n=1 Tax=Fictibacillus nanhaiensis TaxID=742169 RepID=A0ABS2ZRX9_9BACL|nr:glycosyltransferase [Fictibacillus nanhaiensis]